MKKFLLILLLILPAVYAQEIIILKETQSNLELGDSLDVKITFDNPYQSKQTYEIIERIPNGVTLINPSSPDNIETRDGIEVKNYKWIVDLNPNQIGSIAYKIKPDNLGAYTIAPTKILAKNNLFTGNAINFNVNCKSNNKCESNENSLNCPVDCTSSDDGVCDYKKDSICDQDCEDDPDCGGKSLKIGDFLPLIIIFMVIALVIFLVNLSRKKPGGEFKKKALEVVKQYKGLGYADEQIKQEFLKTGWKDKDIDELLKSSL